VTEEQLRAVTAPDTHVWVDGPAGAGKTTVLIERVAHIVETLHGAPDRICVLTFTRDAAAVLVERLEARGIRGCVVGTLHAIAWKIVSTYPSLVDRAEGFRVLQDSEYDAAVRLARWTLFGGTRTTGSKEKVLALVASWMRAANVALYSQVMEGAARVTAEQWAPSWLLVDEAQDLDDAQWSFVERCRAAGARVFAVGSQAQAIYEWRGALPHHVPMWARDVGALQLRLTRNHRCARSIVEVAQAVGDAIPKEYAGAPHAEETGRGEIGSVVRLRADPRRAALAYPWLVVRTVQGWVAQGGEPEDVAVLAAHWDTLAGVQGALESAGFACAERGDNLDTELAEQIRLWVQLLADPTNDILAAALLDTLCSGWNERLPPFLPFGGERSLLDVASEQGLLSTGREVRSILDSMSDAELQFAEPVVEMLAGLTERERLGWSEERDGRRVGAGVTLSSVHGAKGCEWPCVIYLLPDRPGRRTQECLEYVAVTRARDELTVISTFEETGALAGPFRLSRGWVYPR
jgi:superfamily I DNA/RNA helicase